MNNYDKEVLSLMVLFLILSIIFTTIYICYYIDCKKVNIISLIISFIFICVFVFLNLLIILDYFSAIDYDDFENESKFLAKIFSNFYSYFNRINSIMTLAVFPFMINCLETGYHSTCKIILESLCRIGHFIWKKLKEGIFKVLLIIGLVLGIGVVILYYMFRKKYKLKDPLYYFDYIALAMNIKSLIEIYINVGYFISQVVIDSKIEGTCRSKLGCCCNECCFGNPTLNKKYYFFTVRLIMEKTKKYLGKIQAANDAINNAIKKYNNEVNTKFHNFLLNKLQLIKKDLELYKYENIVEANEVVVHREYNINLNMKNLSDRKELNLETKDKVVETKDSEQKKEEEKITKKIEAEDEEKESEKILTEHIRKYKKATRKIKKLKKLFNDTNEDINTFLNPQNAQCKHRCCRPIKYTIYYLAFVIVIMTDIVLPFVLYQNIELGDDNPDTTQNVEGTDAQSSDDEKGVVGTIFLIIAFLIIMTFVAAISCSYTIVMIYSINRRRYISGDILSGKKINDSISLMKTVKQVCGYSFSLVYLNFYLWKIVTEEDIIFYKSIYIPDYKIKHGFGVFMLAKIVVSFFSYIFFKCGCLLKNDLAEFDKNLRDESYNSYADEMKFNTEIYNNKIYQLLVQ